jgi:glutamyl-tRNA(Gln) amidotransferase subunit E
MTAAGADQASEGTGAPDEAGGEAGAANATGSEPAATADDRDYEALGLVAGLEIHQQLDTDTKLFCHCPTKRREPENATGELSRYLHPTPSELGEVDEAAAAESRIDRRFDYLTFDSTCLVEEDEEPPRTLDDEARQVALEIAQLLDAEPVDQAHVMRKIVVDGSNTTGFQRSALVATDGAIETEHGTVGIEDLMLEEESAARIEETDDGVRFALDRLGIPLVEIGTAPDIESPAEARAAAERIGMLLRSTGHVKRGLGTIRQDVNVSIARGARVELKGVQALDTIDDIVRFEVDRQVALAEIASDLRDRDAAVGDPVDITDALADVDSGLVSGTIDDGGIAMAVRLDGFDGLVGRELQPDRRLGTEFADHATRHGVGGVIHTDELPAYGLDGDDEATIREAVDADDRDAVALVVADPEPARAAIEAVAERAQTAIECVPEETRDANEDGTSSYLRPLPGAARMYPETDVPPVDLDPTEVDTPELLTEKVDRYASELGLDAGLAEQVAYGARMPQFEAAVDRGVDPTLAATTLESTLTELDRDGVPVDQLTEAHLLETLDIAADGEIPQEAIPDVLTALAADPDLDAATAVEQEGLGAAAEDEVRSVVASVVERNAEQVEREGMGAFSGLMGECMGELRGQADGDRVSEVLREEIQQRAD